MRQEKSWGFTPVPLQIRRDRIWYKKSLQECTWAVAQEPGDPWLILPLFPTFASSKGDTVILNTITKAEPERRRNQTGPGRRNEYVNSGCCICTFIYRPFSVLSVFRQREGCVCKAGQMTGLTYQAWVTCNLFSCIAVQHGGKCCILGSNLLTLLCLYVAACNVGITIERIEHTCCFWDNNNSWASGLCWTEKEVETVRQEPI